MTQAAAHKLAMCFASVSFQVQGEGDPPEGRGGRGGQGGCVVLQGVALFVVRGKPVQSLQACLPELSSRDWGLQFPCSQCVRCVYVYEKEKWIKEHGP